ncbi:DUF1176 domain-containing protein [Sphingomonas sp. Y38-1Y]|uniref:DUF1176 domain-containing protein n=1 Tax=Sphingomonas sp. Y38-1Y TaxID=3078265 RepID=UPI0028E5E138|nr:DUF1176 domain-containing protein [Sphingomonas sp. Y38-1Y]
MLRTALASTLLALAAPAMAQAAPGELRRFGDWIVGCDNTLRCEAAALGPEADPFDKPLLSFVREPGPGGAIDITLDSEAKLSDITVDGKRTGDQPLAIARAFAAGLGARIGKEGALSLTGAAAALRYIDDRQRRGGTVDAIVARGSASGAAAPRPPAPVIRVPRIAGRAAALAPAMLERMRKTADCQPIDDAAMARPELHPLGGGRTLAIVPCGLGAYQSWSAIYVTDGTRFAPARFDVPPNGDGEVVPTVVTPSYDRGILSSYAKGRGLGDCGVSQSYAWDGRSFRLTERAEMTECRGSRALIRTWIARVAR